MHRVLTLCFILCSLLLLASIAPTQVLAAGSSQTVNFQVHGEPYNFTLTTDSTAGTVTAYSETKFNFTLSGATGEHGWANVTVCKTAGFFPPGQAKPQNIHIYMNGTMVTNTTNTVYVEQVKPSHPVMCIWIYWTYHYSAYQTTADLSLSLSLQAPTLPDPLPILVIVSATAAGYMVIRKRWNREA